MFQEAANFRLQGIATIVVLGISFFLGNSWCHADQVDDILVTEPANTPEQLAQVEDLIEKNQSHPRISELRYFRTGQLMQGKMTTDETSSLINELEEIASAKPDDQISLKAKFRIAFIQHHGLRNFEKSYHILKSIERHPYLNGTDRESDFARTELYVAIAESAGFLSSKPEMKKEAEIYSRMAMDYPYLDIPNRDPYYRKFFNLYGRAGVVYLRIISDDLAKLTSFRIPPSQRDLVGYRAELIQEIGNVQSEQSLSPLGATIEQISQDQQNASEPIRSPQGSSNIVHNRSLATNESGAHHFIYILGISTISVLVITGAIVYARRH